jgi:hypothetical protein
MEGWEAAKPGCWEAIRPGGKEAGILEAKMQEAFKLPRFLAYQLFSILAFKLPSFPAFFFLDLFKVPICAIRYTFSMFSNYRRILI